MTTTTAQRTTTTAATWAVVTGTTIALHHQRMRRQSLDMHTLAVALHLSGAPLNPRTGAAELVALALAGAARVGPSRLAHLADLDQATNRRRQRRVLTDAEQTAQDQFWTPRRMQRCTNAAFRLWLTAESGALPATVPAVPGATIHASGRRAA